MSVLHSMVSNEGTFFNVVLLKITLMSALLGQGGGKVAVLGAILQILIFTCV